MAQRGSGRTTRMLMRAILEASEGKSVTVVVQREAHIPMMIDNVQRMIGGAAKRERKNTLRLNAGLIEFITATNPSFDWREGRVRGSDWPLFVDHFVDESKYAEVGEVSDGGE